LAEICQNRTADKGQIFEGFYVAEIKKCSANESLDITWGICTRNLRSKRYTENFHEFLRCSTKNCFRTATSPNLTSPKLEASLGTKTKIKIIRRGHYNSNNFQDSNKRKRTECKNIGLSPKSAFL
jgi:hypothetical protein